MRTRKLVLAMVWMAVSGTCYGARPVSAQSTGKIRVCVNFPNYASAYVMPRAKIITSQMFATAGVALEWHSAGTAACQESQQTQTVILDFVTDTPASQHPGALAYAQLYEAVHIVVLYDRIQKRVGGPSQACALLAVRGGTPRISGVAVSSQAIAL